MTTNRSGRRAAGTLAVVAALAGCGGGGGGDGPKLTKAQFIPKADVACQKVIADARKRLSDTNATDTSSPEGLAKTIDENVKVGRDLGERLKDLNPPKDPQLDRFFALSEQGADALDGVADAARKKDQATAAKGVTEARRITTEVAGVARSYGFKVCGLAGS